MQKITEPVLPAKHRLFFLFVRIRGKINLSGMLMRMHGVPEEDASGQTERTQSKGDGFRE